jgi:hypothetical protein
MIILSNSEILILIFVFGFYSFISIFSIYYGIRILLKNDHSISMSEKIMLKIIGRLCGNKLRENRENYFSDPNYRRKYAFLNIFSGSIGLLVMIYLIIIIYVKTRKLIF